MRKGFKLYAALWLIALLTFVTALVITPHPWHGFSKYFGSFWVGYIAILVAFLSQFICSVFAFSEDNSQKFFYNLPIIKISYSGLVLTFIVAAIFMLVPEFPLWVGSLLCGAVLLLNIISVIKAKTAADIVSKIDDKVKEETTFIKMLTVEADNLVGRASAPMLKNICKSVYEAVRYSDPVSNAALVDVESQIRDAFNTLVDAVAEDNLDLSESAMKQVIQLVDERAKLCKALK